MILDLRHADFMTKNRVIFIWPVLYTIMMGIVNLICSRVYNTTYSDPNYLMRTAPFIAGLAVLTVLCFIWKKEDLEPQWEEKGKIALFLIVFIPLFSMVLFTWVRQGSLSKAFLVPVLATLCVGIAEEFMFRRILFVGLLKEGKMKRAVIVSAIFFSALHAVNVLAGMPVKNLFVQLAATFLAGLYYALMYNYTKNIFLLIAEHWLWDYVLIYGVNKIPALGAIMFILTGVQIVLTIVLARSERNKSLGAS